MEAEKDFDCQLRDASNAGNVTANLALLGRVYAADVVEFTTRATPEELEKFDEELVQLQDWVIAQGDHAYLRAGSEGYRRLETLMNKHKIRILGRFAGTRGTWAEKWERYRHGSGSHWERLEALLENRIWWMNNYEGSWYAMLFLDSLLELLKFRNITT